MSKAYIFLAATCIATGAVIAFVHWDQKRELQRMREGVYRDVEREQFRKAAASGNAGPHSEDLLVTKNHMPSSDPAK